MVGRKIFTSGPSRYLLRNPQHCTILLKVVGRRLVDNATCFCLLLFVVVDQRVLVEFPSFGLHVSRPRLTPFFSERKSVRPRHDTPSKTRISTVCSHGFHQSRCQKVCIGCPPVNLPICFSVRHVNRRSRSSFHLPNRPSCQVIMVQVL